MNVREILPHINSDQLRERIKEAFEEQGDELPLEICCSHGGWPESDTLTVGTITECIVDPEEIHVTIPVYFDESVPSGCRDMNFREHISGEIPVRIDRTTGDVTFPRED